jgi:chromosome segregation ATPase
MRYIPALFVCLAATCFADNAQITAIDKKIKELKDARARAEMQAYIAGSQADQHMSQDWEDYMEDIDNQSHYQQKVDELNNMIHQLEEERAKLK